MGCGSSKATAADAPADVAKLTEAAAAAPLSAPAASTEAPTPEQAAFMAQLEQCRYVYAGLLQMAAAK